MVESWPVFEKGQGCIRPARTVLVCGGAHADASNRELVETDTHLSKKFLCGLIWSY